MTLSPHAQRVKQFMDLAKQYIPPVPTIPDEKTRLLRARLILEEALETVAALGVDVRCFEYDIIDIDDIILNVRDSTHANLVEIVDGACDVMVVTTGTLLACGVDDVEMQEATDRNNLDKFGPGHSIREDGKLMKPPGYKPVDYQKLLDSFHSSL